MDALELAQVIVNAVSEVVMLADLEGVVWFSGPRLTRTLGWPLDEAIGRRVWDVLDGDGAGGAAEVEEAFRHTLRESPARGAHWSPHWRSLVSRDGQPVSGWLTFAFMTR